jgi:hypothetical protein
MGRRRRCCRRWSSEEKGVLADGKGVLADGVGQNTFFERRRV